MTSIQIAFIALVLVAISITACALLYFISNKKLKQDVAPLQSLTDSKNELQFNRLIAIYNVLDDFILTRRFTRRLAFRYKIIMPNQEDVTKAKTAKVVVTIYAVQIIALLVILLFAPSFLLAIALELTLFSFAVEWFDSSVTKLEIQLYEEIIAFIETFRAKYLICQRDILKAMDEAYYECKPLIKGHVKNMCEILHSKNVMLAVREYESTLPNKYVQLLLAEIVSAYRNSDPIVDGNSVLLKQLEFIQENVGQEIIQINNHSEVFMGTVQVAVIPTLFMDYFVNWADSNLPEVGDILHGFYGIICAVVMLGATAFIRILIRNKKTVFKEDFSEHLVLNYIYKFPFVKSFILSYEDKNYGNTLKMKRLLRQTGSRLTTELLFIKRCLCSVLTFGLVMIVFFFSTAYTRMRALSVVTDTEIATSGAEDEDFDVMKKIAVDKIFQHRQDDVSYEQLENELLAEYDSELKINLYEQVITVIMNHVHTFQTTKFMWYYVFISQVLAVIAFFVPVYLITSRKSAAEIAMEDEIVQFKSIIILLMYSKTTTTTLILKWMTIFSRIFRKSVTKCYNNLAGGESKALRQLQEDEPIETLQRLADCIIACNKASIRDAFAQLPIERAYYMDKRKQLSKKITSNNSAFATTICFLPAMLVILMYLVIPTLMYCSNMLARVMSQVQ